jgi:hypothetical protein
VLRYRSSYTCKSLFVQSQSYFATGGQSLSHSVSHSVRLGTEPLLGHMTRFWLKSRQLQFCLSWGVFPDGRVVLSCNRSQFLSLLAIYTYVHFYKFSLRFFFSLTIIFSCIIFLGLYSRFCTADYARCCYTARGYNHCLDK